MTSRLIPAVLPVMCSLILLSAAGCGGGHHEEDPAVRLFPEVRIPQMVAEDPAEAQAYVMCHYWDGLADTSRRYLCDSAHVGGVPALEVERSFAEYSTWLKQVELGVAREGMARMYEAAAACERADTASNVFETLENLADRYLYDPNSPYRDEDIYGALADRLSAYEGFSEEKRSYYEYQARLSSLNSRGTTAADFRFRDARGVTGHLYGISADYILLFFSNPGCPACKNIIMTLSEELAVDKLISAGKLAVLNIYIDEDLRAWLDYMPIYPKNWYNAYDPDYVIRGENLYNVRAIPSLYLLDRDKTVLLKDAPEEVIFREIAYLAGE